MWTLSETQTRLGNRLAEDSTVFWSLAERTAAINDAQRFISSITKGIPTVVSGDVDYTAPYLTAPSKLLGSYEVAGWVGGSTPVSLRPVTMSYANLVDPGWATRQGVPRWVLAEPSEDRIYFSPTPTTPVAVSARVAVLPADLSSSTDVVFGGEEVMERYQGAMLNFAAAMLLLKERYDNDAERFWQFAVQELQAVGVDPAKIPSSPTPVAPQSGGE